MTGVYCVFCRTGFEAGIESRLKRRGYATLVPKIKKFKPSGGKLVEKELCLLPGYVFFETDEKELDVRSINTLQNAIKLLQYDDFSLMRRAPCLAFALSMPIIRNSIRLIMPRYVMMIVNRVFSSILFILAVIV